MLAVLDLLPLTEPATEPAGFSALFASVSIFLEANPF
jgi:hypothetical protein